MKQDLHTLAARCQTILRAKAIDHPGDWPDHVDRIYLDAWASLYRWHACGERVWRISAAMAEETEGMVLPSDLRLATARVRGEAVAYQLPLRSEWIVLARHVPAPSTVEIYGDQRWAYAQPVLTYCTMLADGSMAAGYYSLLDMPTPALLSLRAGHTLGRSLRALTEASIAEEEYRVALALIHHYMP